MSIVDIIEACVTFKERGGFLREEDESFCMEYKALKDMIINWSISELCKLPPLEVNIK